MLTSGVIEIILYVEDMQQQVTFYRDVLELPMLFPTGLVDYKMAMWVVFEAGACKLALHGGGRKRLGQDTPMLVFGVTDIQTVHATLRARGVQLQEIFTPGPNVLVCHGTDPEGNPIALEEHIDP
ncbi:MAG: VOC family protein [Caldilineaceae bacterium]|nr:VOC family protein [Caldilineaceae bacterium]